MKILRINAAGRLHPITEEQARWLAAELRMLRPLDTAGPAENVAVMLERAIEGQVGEPKATLRPDEARALLEVLDSDRFELAPEPRKKLLELRDALEADLEM